MTMLRPGAFAAAMLLFMTAAGADTSWDSFNDCTGKSGATNADWQKCGVDYVAREDKKLNTSWKKAFDAAGPLTKTDLLEEQRAWISYKEKACNFFSNGEQGREGQVLHIFSCKAAVIDQRIKELEDYRECWAEGAC